MCTLWRPGGLVFNAPINFDEIVCNNKRAISTNWSPQLTHPRSWVSSLRKQLLIAVVIPAKTSAAPHTWEHWRLFGRGSGYSECICSVCLWVRLSWGTFRGHWKIRGWAAGFCRAGAVDVAPGRRKPCAYSHPKFSTVIVLDLDRAWKECRIQAASPEPGDKWGACRCLQPSCAVPVLRGTLSSVCSSLAFCSAPTCSMQSNTRHDAVMPSAGDPYGHSWGTEDSTNLPSSWVPSASVQFKGNWGASTAVSSYLDFSEGDAGLRSSVMPDANIWWIRAERWCPLEALSSLQLRAKCLPVAEWAGPDCRVRCTCTHLLWMSGLAPTCCSSLEYYIFQSGIQYSLDSTLVHTAKPWQKLFNALYKYFLFNNSGQRCWVEEPN